MDYARKHIKRYWGIVYKRTLGLALITLAIVLSMGLTFNILRGIFAVNNYLNYLFFWVFLIVIAIVIIASSFFHSHVTSVKFMNEAEHNSHSRRVALWLILVVLGIVVFILPSLLVRAILEPLVLLFTFGGVLLVFYATIRVLFKHSYGELAIGAGAFWIMFVLGAYQLGNSNLAYVNIASFYVYFAALSITVISGFTGLALLINSSRAALSEFTSVVAELGVKDKRRRQRR
jgi:hypothetical protein